MGRGGPSTLKHLGEEAVSGRRRSGFRERVQRRSGFRESRRPTLAAVGRAAAAPCGRPEAAAAAPPPPRPPPDPLPPPPPSPPSLRPPPPPPPPPTAAAALARLLGRRQQSPSRPARPVHPPAASMRARCRSDPHRPRRSRRTAAARRASSRRTARAFSFPCCSPNTSPLLLAGCGCGFNNQKGEWRPKSRKNESGLLPEFQVALLAP
jgi:hypothetical protein